MNRASVFEWHKKLKEGRESVREDERCERIKEVRTAKLIGQIKNFIDKERRVSIETISAQFDVSVGTVHTIIREELKMRKVCPKGAHRRSERKTLSWQQGDGRADQFRSRSSWCSGDLRWKLDLLLWLRNQETEFPVEACWLSQTHEGQTEQIHPQTFDDPFFDSTCMIYMHWVPTGQTVNKEYFVKVLREFSKIFRRKSQALFKLGQWHFHSDNAPVHNSILITDYLTKMGIRTVPQPPYSSDLARWDFWLFPKLKEKLRGCRYETIELMKEAVTKVIDMFTQENFHWGLPKVVRTVQQVHCSRRWLLRRGLEFHVCTIDRSANTKKVGKPIVGTSYISVLHLNIISCFYIVIMLYDIIS